MDIPVLVLVFLIGYILSALDFFIVEWLYIEDKVSQEVFGIAFAVFVSLGAGLITVLFLQF